MASAHLEERQCTGDISGYASLNESLFQREAFALFYERHHRREEMRISRDPNIFIRFSYSLAIWLRRTAFCSACAIEVLVESLDIGQEVLHELLIHVVHILIMCIEGSAAYLRFLGELCDTDVGKGLMLQKRQKGMLHALF